MFNQNSSSFLNISSNNFLNNSISNLTKIGLGSTIYLNDPGKILIEKCLFSFNYGIIGSCIYYSETYLNSSIELISNNFTKNFALIGAGAIFIKNNYENLTFLRQNTFKENIAYYGNDYSTAPYRMTLKNHNINSKQKLYKIEIIPGITLINFEICFVDYFGQRITKIFGDFSSLLLLKNFKNFSDILDSALKIDGKNIVFLLNGKH